MGSGAVAISNVGPKYSGKPPAFVVGKDAEAETGEKARIYSVLEIPAPSAA